MEYIVLVILTLSGLLTVCQATALQLEEEQANCTVIGVNTECCMTPHCFWAACPGGDIRCEMYLENAADQPADCKDPENKCSEVMESVNGTYNASNLLPGTLNTTAGPVITTLVPVTSEPVIVSNGTNPPEPPTESPITQKPDVPTEKPTESPTEKPTTEKPTTEKPTTEPQKQTATDGMTTQATPTPVPCQRQFDAASFIGGIVFIAGVFAIGAFGYMYYRSRQDVNYSML